jgi:predicted glycoside hydrolase/deacetylase ChbG (UPF0249 family)
MNNKLNFISDIIAGGPAFDQAVSLARQCSGLGVGVHLTLVGLRPMAHGDVRSLLTGDGSFYRDYLAFTREYLTGRIELQHVETELRRQMQKVVGSGIKITHLDSHQHLHVLGLSASEFPRNRLVLSVWISGHAADCWAGPL